MSNVIQEHLDEAINAVLEGLDGIADLYPNQRDLLKTLLDNDNIFYTASTNGGKTLPTLFFPAILQKLSCMGYNFPPNPKVLFVTALNALQLSLINNAKGLGIDCEAVVSDNVEELLNSNTSVLFISPEVLKLPKVTQTLLLKRSSIVLKVVDECHLGMVISIVAGLSQIMVKYPKVMQSFGRIEQFHPSCDQIWSSCAQIKQSYAYYGQRGSVRGRLLRGWLWKFSSL